MDTIPLPPEWQEFLNLLIANDADFMLIGGLAVAHYGYFRATFDMDLWVSATDANAKAIANACQEFGLDLPGNFMEILCKERKTLRFGRQPLRIELLVDISGCDYTDCKPRAIDIIRDGIPLKVIALEDLKANKRASGRYKDLDDLEHLPRGNA